ncbi:DUF397 domain-containing protein [Actinomadura fulvescens]|uniref:DUF397 domain-containing protein n=1 Tax=Actinomadura fulvescens TaxID=46160 RepID=A0ABP6C3L7_9ACTN
MELKWRKSSQSLSNGGECVELASFQEILAVRDSKDPQGAILLAARADLRKAIHRKL